MPSVFQNQTIETRPRYIPKNVKHEESLQKQVCHYLRLRYPNVIFRSDFASGLKMSKYQAIQHKNMQSSRAWVDLFIYTPRKIDGKQYAGLGLELKKEGTTIIVKQGPRKGQIVANDHIKEQYYMMQTLQKLGYYCDFGIGYDHAVAIIDWYMGAPKIENSQIF